MNDEHTSSWTHMHAWTGDPQNRAGFQDLHRQRQNEEKVLLIRIPLGRPEVETGESSEACLTHTVQYKQEKLPPTRWKDRTNSLKFGL